jgi:ABC-type nickel/cobalt efflux system permease component RcnA
LAFKLKNMMIIITGFIASVAHVVTGPDHLAAVTPLAIDSHRKSWIIGLAWGIGHTIGILLIGMLFLLFKEILPIEGIAKYSDKIVGFLLIGIGSWALIKIYIRHSHGNRPHTHFHTRPFLYAHIHRHTHSDSPEHEHKHIGNVKQNSITALFIGIIHGFAGFSHLFALLPSLALPTIWLSIAYIAAFAAGTITTMVIFAFILGLVAFQSAQKEKQTFLKWFTITGGVLAIVIGIIWIGFAI